MQKTTNPRQPPNQSKKKDSSKGTHKATHVERPIPMLQPTEQAEILPATHIDDDPESYRLT